VQGDSTNWFKCARFATSVELIWEYIPQREKHTYYNRVIAFDVSRSTESIDLIIIRPPGISFSERYTIWNIVDLVEVRLFQKFLPLVLYLPHTKYTEILVPTPFGTTWCTSYSEFLGKSCFHGLKIVFCVKQKLALNETILLISKIQNYEHVVLFQDPNSK
jgi:hypothetical protein